MRSDVIAGDQRTFSDKLLMEIRELYYELYSEGGKTQSDDGLNPEIFWSSAELNLFTKLIIVFKYLSLYNYMCILHSCIFFMCVYSCI